MSEFSTHFYAYFPDHTEFNISAKGFKELLQRNYQNAIACFQDNLLGSMINNQFIVWDLEYFSKSDQFLEGSILAQETRGFEPVAFLKTLSVMGAELVLGIIIDETGNRRSIGYEKGKKSAASGVKDKMINLDVNFALRFTLGKHKKTIELLNQGANPNIKIDGAPLIMHLVDANNIQLLDTLFDMGVDVNAQDNDKETALNRLIRLEAPLKKITRFLEHGANPNIPNKHGYTAVCYALTSYSHYLEKRWELVQLLCDYGLKIDANTNPGSPPLHIAIDVLADKIKSYPIQSVRDKILNQAKPMLDNLIAAGDDINRLDDENIGILTKASAAPDLVALLKEMGAVEKH